MRIFSPYYDYYDSLTSHDKEDRVFNRVESELILSSQTKGLAEVIEYVRNMPRSYGGYSYRLDAAVLGFCGKLYPIYWIFGKWCSTTKQLSDCIDPRNKAARELFELPPPKKPGTRWSRGSSRFWIEKHAEDVGTPSIPEDIFLQVGSPIFWITEMDKVGEVLVNPCLKNLGFASVMDSYTAYQEIDMYLGTFLTVGEREERVRGDNEVRDSHGYDKFSFRKGKG